MRISVEDKLARRERILQALVDGEGLTEAELTVRLKLERRTVNNHLRWLYRAGKIYKDGLVWYAKNSRSIRLIDQIIDLLDQLKRELKEG